MIKTFKNLRLIFKTLFTELNSRQIWRFIAAVGGNWNMMDWTRDTSQVLLMENFLNSTLHLAALHIQVWGVLLNIFYLIFLSVLHQMETFPRLAADYSQQLHWGGQRRAQWQSVHFKWFIITLIDLSSQSIIVLYPESQISTMSANHFQFRKIPLYIAIKLQHFISQSK